LFNFIKIVRKREMDSRKPRKGFQNSTGHASSNFIFYYPLVLTEQLTRRTICTVFIQNLYRAQYLYKRAYIFPDMLHQCHAKFCSTQQHSSVWGKVKVCMQGNTCNNTRMSWGKPGRETKEKFQY